MDFSRRCILCGKYYHPIGSIGKLQCYYHPLLENTLTDGDSYPKNHFECCGAVHIENYCEHFERTKPYGCYNIDHVSSIEDLNALLKKPFVLCPLTECKLEIPKKDIFDTYDKIKEPIKIGVPFKEKIDLNLKEYEMDLIRGTKAFDVVYDTRGQPEFQSYNKVPKSSIVKELVNENVSQNTNFIPFVIIRRISEEPNKTRKIEIRSRVKCKYFPQ